MLGLMQNYPLNIQKLLEYSEACNSKGEIVSRRLEGDIHRYSYRDLGKRARSLASVLQKLGVDAGDVIGTIAWNGYRHIELYFAVPGIQAMYHTINPRLSDEQLAFVINHAKDKFLFVEAGFVSRIEAIQDRLEQVRGYVILCEEGDMPSTNLNNAMCYEALLSTGDEDFEWDEFDENTACAICYTSGTTGNPKGVVYSHRALILQAFSFIIGAELTCRDILLPVVPMFHVNGWTIPFMGALLGAKLVLPGKNLDGASLYELMQMEKVTFSAGVPTVWQLLIEHLQANDLKLPHLNKILIGGSAAPRSMLETFRDEYQVDAMHAWGMTETSSMGSSPAMPSFVEAQGEEAIIRAKMKQGRAYFGLEMKLSDECGNSVPKDGRSQGHLLIRGWAVASQYLNSEASAEFTQDGWFETGDIATIDGDGFLQLTDRAKDMIKSGGEWISSIELENAAMAHSEIREAAVIGVAHPKWDERPILIAVAGEHQPTKEDVIKFLEDKVAKWWLPDDVIFVDALPYGSTGKIEKKVLRERYRGYLGAL